jgi:methyltransferase OMS1
MTFSKGTMVVGAIATYAAAVFVGYQYARRGKAQNLLNVDNETGTPIDPKNIVLQDSQRLASFNKHATTYDNEIGWDEFFMGLNFLRWWHLNQAKGKVLEIGCGTGRNFDYYGNAESVIAIDAAESMVKQASEKVLHKKNIRVMQMNAHQLQFENHTFDTVVDTFGLCSYEDPVAVLQEMKRVCRPNGKILLIEHGRGDYDWINNKLDCGASRHAHNWGCIWNRDITKLVNGAGLKVLSVSRFHFGTTYLIEANP